MAATMGPIKLKARDNQEENVKAKASREETVIAEGVAEAVRDDLMDMRANEAGAVNSCQLNSLNTKHHTFTRGLVLTFVHISFLIPTLR